MFFSENKKDQKKIHNLDISDVRHFLEKRFFCHLLFTTTIVLASCSTGKNPAQETEAGNSQDAVIATSGVRIGDHVSGTFKVHKQQTGTFWTIKYRISWKTGKTYLDTSLLEASGTQVPFQKDQRLLLTSNIVPGKSWAFQALQTRNFFAQFEVSEDGTQVFSTINWRGMSALEITLDQAAQP